MQDAHDHSSAEWADVERHLPDLATSTGAQLELTADVLRARRFNADALRFYNAALSRGANPQLILKKMGIACLEMQQPALARTLFQRAVRGNKHDAVAWNDMAAADLVLGQPRLAVAEYRHAVKDNRTNAIFHANLALAYFETNSPDDARRELARAVHLDPEVLHHNGSGGYNAQLLSSQRFGDICVQMAHLAAAGGDQAALLEWLGKASERDIDLQAAMEHDPVLRPWLHDPRIHGQLEVLLRNHERLNARPGTHLRAAAAAPSLGPASTP